jgi:hypothetical protein
MQSALATTRPIKNRLFSLSPDLQALIYGYVDWQEELASCQKSKDMFRILRPDILQEHMHYYWACQYDIALRGMPTLKNAPYYFCAFCESIMHREDHKISKINPKYAYFTHGNGCRAMCVHLGSIQEKTGSHYTTLGYKAYYDGIYKDYFEDPDNKFDKDEYEELCVAYPEKRLAYDYPCK